MPKAERAVRAAKTKKHTPLNMLIFVSVKYLAARPPPMMAIYVATPCPKIAPPVTPAGAKGEMLKLAALMPYLKHKNVMWITRGKFDQVCSVLSTTEERSSLLRRNVC